MDQIMRLLDFRKPRDIVCTMDRANTFGDAEDHVKILLRTRGKPDVDLEISSCALYSRPTFTVYATHGGLSGGAAGLEWQYFDPRKAPAQRLIRQPLPGPSYCHEKLEFVSARWEPSEEQRHSFAYMSQCYYENVYNVVRKGAAPEITPEQVRVQIAVIEACHRQNRLSRLPAKGWPAGD